LIVFVLIDIPFLFTVITKSKEGVVLSKEFSKCDTCSKPDIYLIVADEYAGEQELSEMLHFDNLPFERTLESRGFHIIKHSKSNYNYTQFSMASMLSMNFLKGIEGRHSNRDDINTCSHIANKSSLWDFLTANGYEIKNFSFFNINDIPARVREYFTPIGIDLITSQTFLSRLDRDVRFNLITRFKIKSEIKRTAFHVKYENEKLYHDLLVESGRRSKRPRFVYAHLTMPHFPYYYDSTGHAYPLEEVAGGDQIKKDHYLQYLQYCNKKFISLIDAVLKNSEKPPVIIFIGDHGWRHFTEPVDTKYYFMNLSSIYLPDKNYSPFYDGMSNGNLFRTLLNTQFHQKLGLIKDSTILIKD
jgi:hypothetical protein